MKLRKALTILLIFGTILSLLSCGVEYTTSSTDEVKYVLNKERSAYSAISNYFFNFAYQRLYSDSLERPMLNSEDYKIKKILTVEDGRLAIFDCSSSNSAKKLYKEFTKMIWERTYYKVTIKVEGKYLLHGDRELVSTVREKIE